jgi:hypothetical protein
MTRMSRTAWGLDTSDDQHQWRVYAACRGYDPSWWDLVGKKFTDSNRKAQEICRSCPVRSECADMAASTGSWGVILAGVAHYGGDRARTTVGAGSRP